MPNRNSSYRTGRRGKKKSRPGRGRPSLLWVSAGGGRPAEQRCNILWTKCPACQHYFACLLAFLQKTITGCTVFMVLGSASIDSTYRHEITYILATGQIAPERLTEKIFRAADKSMICRPGFHDFRIVVFQNRFFVGLFTAVVFPFAQAGPDDLPRLPDPETALTPIDGRIESPVIGATVVGTDAVYETSKHRLCA